MKSIPCIYGKPYSARGQEPTLRIDTERIGTDARRTLGARKIARSLPDRPHFDRDDMPITTPPGRLLPARAIAAPAGELECWVRPLAAAAGPWPLCVVRHDPALFRPEAFDEHGLVRPPAIARSVLRRQAEFFHGRMAARRALGALGHGAASPLVGAAGQPVWPAGVVGSITHSGPYAAAVALDGARWRGVGIDIECVADQSGCAALMSVAIDGAELATLRAQAGRRDIPELLTLAFSAKESLYKAAFDAVGRYFGFECARVLEVDVAGARLALRIEENLGGPFMRGHVCQVCIDTLAEGYVLTSFAW
jgi:4'-phosphopantetheinyl transferase EntD